MLPIQTSHGVCNATYRLATGLCVLLLSLSAHAAFAANAANSTYQQDREFCMSGQSNQDKKTCLREAGAARAEAKKGNLSEGAVSYEQNALARCKVLPPADQADCTRRVHGGGTVSGSVASGGIIRETTTTIVEPQPALPPPPSVMPRTPSRNMR